MAKILRWRTGIIPLRLHYNLALVRRYKFLLCSVSLEEWENLWSIFISLHWLAWRCSWIAGCYLCCTCWKQGQKYSARKWGVEHNWRFAKCFEAILWWYNNYEWLKVLNIFTDGTAITQIAWGHLKLQMAITICLNVLKNLIYKVDMTQKHLRIAAFLDLRFSPIVPALEHGCVYENTKA